LKGGENMWIPKGYIVHTGNYPDTTEYLIYDDYEDKIRWTEDSNNAVIFKTLDYCAFICEKFGIKDYSVRIVVMSDMAMK
jgi:hypothetical protein